MYGPKWLFLLMYMSHDINVGTGCILGRALGTKETLPDFREVSDYPTSTNIPQVDGLSTDTPVLGHHKKNKKKIKTSLFDPLSYVGRNSSGQERKFIYSTRAMCGYQKHRISPRIQARSSGNQRFRV